MTLVRGLSSIGLVLAVAMACGGRSSQSSSDDDAANGGDPGTGGTTTRGGTAGTTPGGSAGISGTGGTAFTGGAPTTGGAPVTGGAPTTGGTNGTGGVPSRPGCVPQDVRGVGDCAAAFGVFFLGDRCGWLGGCSCAGADCQSAYASEEACEQARRGCVVGCTPQDATFVGGCEPGLREVFTGVSCVQMVGCSCVGDDCANVYTPAGVYPDAEADAEISPCRLAHLNCFDEPRSCEETRAVYDEYASRNACSDDSDCVLNQGHCGVGLGDCYYMMNRQWPASGMQELADAWLASGCTASVCDCAAPPSSVRCVEGRCAAGD